jgi:hypothetical protein
MRCVRLRQAASPARAGSQTQASEGDTDACCGGALMAWLWRKTFFNLQQAASSLRSSQGQATEGDTGPGFGGALMAWFWREDIKRDFGGVINVDCDGRRFG